MDSCQIPEVKPGSEVRLTQLCPCAGCAAKIKAADLERLLALVSYPLDERALAGQSSGDDAVVVQLRPDLALVQTVDFFPPVVDDPLHFGRVAAANALSDVYAMGGVPFTAMNITCFPLKSLGVEVLAQILRGGLEKVLEAGAVMAGGHTVQDPEPKFGLAVTGLIDPKRLVRKDGAKAGDLLVLTKPLGTGVLNTAHKFQDLKAEELEELLGSMETLNKEASQIMVQLGVEGATDITGYGLLGHALEMAQRSGTRFTFQASALPWLSGAREAYRKGYISGGSKANLDFVHPQVEVAPGVSEEDIGLMADAQTSGGLLIAIDPQKAEQLLELLPKLYSAPALIGRVEAHAEGETYLKVEP